MKLFLYILCSFALLSCTKQQIKCDLEDGLEGTIAYAIETIGQCSGSAAVRASVNSWVDSANSCSTNVTKMRGSIGVCSIVVSALSQAAQGPLDNAINSKFPGWNCDPTMLVSAVETVANAACSAVFPGMLAKKK